MFFSSLSFNKGETLPFFSPTECVGYQGLLPAVVILSPPLIECVLLFGLLGLVGCVFPIPRSLGQRICFDFFIRGVFFFPL